MKTYKFREAMDDKTRSKIDDAYSHLLRTEAAIEEALNYLKAFIKVMDSLKIVDMSLTVGRKVEKNIYKTLKELLEDEDIKGTIPNLKRDMQDLEDAFINE